VAGLEWVDWRGGCLLSSFVCTGFFYCGLQRSKLETAKLIWSNTLMMKQKKKKTATLKLKKSPCDRRLVIPVAIIFLFFNAVRR